MCLKDVRVQLDHIIWQAVLFSIWHLFLKTN